MISLAGVVLLPLTGFLQNGQVNIGIPLSFSTSNMKTRTPLIPPVVPKGLRRDSRRFQGESLGLSRIGRIRIKGERPQHSPTTPGFRFIG